MFTIVCLNVILN